MEGRQEQSVDGGSLPHWNSKRWLRRSASLCSQTLLHGVQGGSHGRVRDVLAVAVAEAPEQGGVQ